jgi:hypothetical protein
MVGCLLAICIFSVRKAANMPRIVALLQPVFYFLPGFVGYFLAACGLSALFLTNELKKLENHRILGFVLAGIIALGGLVAVVSDSVQKGQAETDRLQLTGQIGTLIASAQVQATKDDLLRIQLGMEQKFDADLATLNHASASGVKQPGKKEPSKVKPEVNAPVIPTVENTTMVQRPAPSNDPQLPYGLQVIVQSNIVIQPVAMGFECDGPVGKVDFFVAGQGVYMSKQTGVMGQNNNIAIVKFGLPALRPETPMVVTLLSKSQIRVTKILKLAPY